MKVEGHRWLGKTWTLELTNPDISRNCGSLQRERMAVQIIDLLLQLRIAECQEINAVNRFSDNGSGIARLSVLNNFAQMVRIETDQSRPICMTNDGYLPCSKEPLRNDDGA